MPLTANRVSFTVLAKSMRISAEFYRELAGFQQVEATDWYIVLRSPDGMEIAFADEVSEFTPRHAWGVLQGVYLSIQVDDILAAVERARAMGVEVIDAPRAMEYGATRALVRDPNNLIVELLTPTAALQARSDVRFAPTAKDPAIDQQQPEENADHT